MKTRYFGPPEFPRTGRLFGTAFGAVASSKDEKAYVVFAVNNDLYAYHPNTGLIKHVSHWRPEEVAATMKNSVQGHCWHQFTVLELENLYPHQMHGLEFKLVKSFFESLPNAKVLIDQPTKDGQGFFAIPKKKKVMSVIGQPPIKPAKPAEIRPKKAALYFNTAAKQVQRIVEIQGSLYWSSYHKQECKPYPRSSFRLATQAEVDYYLANAN